jgi:hypothetical protein
MKGITMEHVFKGKEKLWAKVIAMAWLDEEFKKKLMADPTAVLKQHGIEFPGGLRINILEGKHGEINVTLPPKPEQTEGSVQELEEKLSAPAPFWPYFRA